MRFGWWRKRKKFADVFCCLLERKRGEPYKKTGRDTESTVYTVESGRHDDGGEKNKNAINIKKQNPNKNGIVKKNEANEKE